MTTTSPYYTTAPHDTFGEAPGEEGSGDANTLDAQQCPWCDAATFYCDTNRRYYHIEGGCDFAGSDWASGHRDDHDDKACVIG
jgi:hypothetical protein